MGCFTRKPKIEKQVEAAIKVASYYSARPPLLR
jgi:hypothetical protein